MSSINMDVDDGSPEPPQSTATILVHPLAIVNISDQYTRIACGGSPLDSSTPVTGLLFGTTDTATDNNNNSTTIVIRDAAEDNVTVSCAQQQVSLHQAVFAQHKVVGWYRADACDGPTVEDLVRTKQFIREHQQQNQQGPFLFALLQVTDNTKKKAVSTESNDELPLSVYMLDDDKNALLAMENWKLDTAEAERLALERVVREETSSTTNTKNKVLSKMDQIQESFTEIQNRMEILYQFLNDMQNAKLPIQHSLLRQVQGVLLLLQQLGTRHMSVLGESEEYHLIQQLTAVTKTITAVQAYADKFRVTGTDFAVVVGKAAASAAPPPAASRDAARRF